MAVAVALFLSCGEKEYAFLEKEPLEVPPERKLGHLNGGRYVARCRDDGDAAAEPKKIPPKGL